jgi:hypothetical protein
VGLTHTLFDEICIALGVSVILRHTVADFLINFVYSSG